MYGQNTKKYKFNRVFSSMITKITIILMCIFLASCAKYDRVQATNDCSFDEMKSERLNDSENRRANYILSCMSSKGYLYSFENGCNFDMFGISTCYKYTWRVFL